MIERTIKSHQNKRTKEIIKNKRRRMAKGVQLFITFVMISMLISTGNYLHAM